MALGSNDQDIILSVIGQDNASAVMAGVSQSIDQMGTHVTGLSQTMNEQSQTLTQYVEAHKIQFREAGTLLVGIGATITGTAALAVAAALSQQQSVAQLNQALKNIGTSYEANKSQIEDLIAAEERKTNYSDVAQRDALNSLVTITGNYTLAMQALPAVLDLAAWKNMDLNSAALLVGRALEGNTANLSRYGIELTKGATQTEILAEFTKQFGGQAEAAANPLIELKNTMGELFAAVGTLLLPALKAVVDLLIKIIQPIQDFIEHTGTAGKVIADIVVGFGLFAGAAGTVLLLLPKLVMGMQALSGLTGIGGVSMALTGVAGGGGLVAGLGGLIAAAAPAALAVAAIGGVAYGAYYGISKLTEGTMSSDEALKILNMTFTEAITKYRDIGHVILAANEALKDQNLTLAEYRAKQDDVTTSSGHLDTALGRLAGTVIDLSVNTDIWARSNYAATIAAEAIRNSADNWSHSIYSAETPLQAIATSTDNWAHSAYGASIAIDNVTDKAKDNTAALSDQKSALDKLNSSVDSIVTAYDWAHTAVGQLGVDWTAIIETAHKHNMSIEGIEKTLHDATVAYGDCGGAVNALGLRLVDFVNKDNMALLTTNQMGEAIRELISNGLNPLSPVFAHDITLLAQLTQAFNASTRSTNAATQSLRDYLALVQAQGQIQAGLIAGGAGSVSGQEWMMPAESVIGNLTGQAGGAWAAGSGNWYDLGVAAAGQAYQAGGVPAETAFLTDFARSFNAATVGLSSDELHTEVQGLVEAWLAANPGSSFQHGGVVPGLFGAPQLIVAHGGERYLGAGPGGDIVIPISLDGRLIARYTVDIVSRQVKLQGVA